MMTMDTMSRNREEYSAPQLWLLAFAVEQGFTQSYEEDDEDIELS